jgi:hypothetical protein
MSRENVGNMPKNGIKEALLTGLRSCQPENSSLLDSNYWPGVITAFDQYFVSSSVQSPEDYSNASYFIGFLVQENLNKIDDSLREIATQVKDPSLAMWLLRSAPNDWQFHSLIHPNFSQWNGVVEKTVFYIWRLQVSVARSETSIALLRTIIIDGPSSSREMAISRIADDLNYVSYITEEVILLITTTFPRVIDVFYRIGSKYSPRRSWRGSSSIAKDQEIVKQRASLSISIVSHGFMNNLREQMALGG